MNQKTELKESIEKHGKALIEFFNLPKETNVDKLSRQLFRLENKGHRLCEQYCNGEIESNIFEKQLDDIEYKTKKLLNNTDLLYINSDPRGYCLKINLENGLDFYYRDFGGYGIIAPDLRNSF